MVHTFDARPSKSRKRERGLYFFRSSSVEERFAQTRLELLIVLLQRESQSKMFCYDLVSQLRRLWVSSNILFKKFVNRNEERPEMTMDVDGE
jgi:hypothetical protein